METQNQIDNDERRQIRTINITSQIINMSQHEVNV